MSLLGCSSVPKEPSYSKLGSVSSATQYVVYEQNPNLVAGVVGAGVGGVVGNQFGAGRGKTAMAVIGSVIGSQVGSNMAKTTTALNMVEIRALMDDGTSVKVYYQDIGFVSGQRISIKMFGDKVVIDKI